MTTIDEEEEEEEEEREERSVEQQLHTTGEMHHGQCNSLGIHAFCFGPPSCATQTLHSQRKLSGALLPGFSWPFAIAFLPHEHGAR